MSFISNIWDKIAAAVANEEVVVKADMTELEQKFLPMFDAWLNQVEATIGAQGVTILEQGLSDIATVVASGGNVGVAIAALVPQVTAQVKDDLKQDATNAAHGAVAMIIASATQALTAAAPAVTGA